VLSEAQIHRYAELRGYGATPTAHPFPN
jgi:hypothetical protein